MSTVRVAAIQMQSCLGNIQANLQHALPLVEQAAKAGAQIVILPELAATGYSLSKLVWDAAETRDGQTVRWLREVSQRFGLYLGIGFVEADGEDFFNTFALSGPDGNIVGFVRKTMAEVNIFRCAYGSHVINTKIGKIGIGICADNHFVPLVRQMQAESVDLMLMPHANPGPFKAGGLISEEDICTAHDKARNLAPLYTRLLGVPAIYVNHVGPRGREKWAGLLGSLLNADQVGFLGLSTITDSDGSIKAQMDDSEGVIVADVALEPTRKVRTEPVRYGRYGGGWVEAGTSGNVGRDVICYVDSFLPEFHTCSALNDGKKPSWFVDNRSTVRKVSTI